MKKTFLKILPLILMFPASVVRAIDTPESIYKQFCPNPSECIDISSKDKLILLMATLIGDLRSVFWIIAVAMLIYAGYLFLFGGANENNVKKARQVLTYAIIGMVLGLVAASIPLLVKNILTPSGQ